LNNNPNIKDLPNRSFLRKLSELLSRYKGRIFLLPGSSPGHDWHQK
jgi:hypothetical protein